MEFQFSVVNVLKILSHRTNARLPCIKISTKLDKLNAFGTETIVTERKYIKINPNCKSPVWVSDANQRHCFGKINFIRLNKWHCHLIGRCIWFFSLLLTYQPSAQHVFKYYYYSFWIWVFNLSNVKSGNFQFKVLFCHCIVVSFEIKSLYDR